MQLHPQHLGTHGLHAAHGTESYTRRLRSIAVTIMLEEGMQHMSSPQLMLTCRSALSAAASRVTALTWYWPLRSNVLTTPEPCLPVACMTTTVGFVVLAMVRCIGSVLVARKTR